MKLFKGDITVLELDCICVNAANKKLIPGSGETRITKGYSSKY